MAWTPLTFVSCGVLTAGMMTQLQENFAAVAGGQPGAPPLAVNSLSWSGVASGAELSVSSRAALRGMTASDVASVAFLNVSSQWNGRNALLTEQLSAAGLNVASLGVVRSLAVSQAASAGTLNISGVPPASPAAHTLYCHPASGAPGFALPMDPASALQSLAAALTAAQGGIAAGNLEGWHEVGAAGEPAFQNSWVHFGASQETAAFRKDATGRVFLKGMVKNGTIGSVPVFTLPAGYRPGAGMTQKYFVQFSNAAAGFLVVVSNGEVWAQTGSNVSFSLSCSFLAEG